MSKRSRNIYDPAASKPFKISRSRLEDFLYCPRCFYLDRRLGVEPPGSPPFNLNIAVDALLKKEFDGYRDTKRPHPLMLQYKIDAIPFPHTDLDIWRSNFKGLQYQCPGTNLIFTGAIDDVWEAPNGDLIVVDYKATSKTGEITLEDEWKVAYKRQMEMYQWLFRRNGFKVSKTGYFVYCNGINDADEFVDCLKFKTVVLPYEGDDSWVEGVILKAYQCLQLKDIPAGSADCEYCDYRREAAALEKVVIG